MASRPPTFPWGTAMTGAKGDTHAETPSPPQPSASKPSAPTGVNLSTTYADNSSLQITSHKLNGKNYLPQSRSVEMVIRGKGRYGYLNNLPSDRQKLALIFRLGMFKIQW